MSKINNNSQDSLQIGKVKISSNSSTLPGTILMVLGCIFAVGDLLLQLFKEKEKCKADVLNQTRQ